MPPASQPTKKDASALYLPGAIVVAGVLIAGGLYFGLAHQGGAAAGDQGQQVSVNIKDVKTAGEPYIGKANAPVTMAFWSDFQCPYCKAVETGGVPQIPITPALPDLIKNYVDTGKLKIVFKDYPFLGQDSITDGEYARSVWALYPDQYLAFRTAMYEAQDEEGDQGFGDAASVDQLIKTKFPQMDDAKIKADIAKNKDVYDAAMTADRNEGSSMGVSGTPGFIIGTTLIPGAAELSTFTDAIDPLLK